MGKKKSTMVLGYTRGGHEVLLPTRQSPDITLCVSWTPGDHLDASRILSEHGERAKEPVGAWCAQWASAHWDVGKKAKKHARSRANIRGAAETTILSGRRR